MRSAMVLTPDPTDLQGAAPFEIAGRRIYPQRNEVVVGGERRRLESRHMKVLLCLARGAGEAVEREDLLDAGWGARLVGDDSLTQAISRLRRALDDPRGSDCLIETIPKVGYRLTQTPEPMRRIGPAMSFGVAGASASIVRAAASWAGLHARTVVFASAVLVAAAAFGWRASDLAWSRAQPDEIAQSGTETPAVPTPQRLLIRKLLVAPGAGSPPDRFRTTDI
jgi:DNA-binding winged helix-turn-helix (wHTH) protein